LTEIEYILTFLPQELAAVFRRADSNILYRISEIRLRKNNYLVVVIKNSSYFMDEGGDLYDYPSGRCVKISAESLDEMFLAFCEYSLYSNAENIKKGFITLANGARIGIAGTAVYDSGTILSVKDITSLNIRIPREVKGCSESVLNFLYVNAFPSVIVAGKANSGKTTLLRDMARGLSDGFNHRFAKVVVVDERNEICGKREDRLSLHAGVNTDVLSGFSKAQGIELATRTLSPEMIICDEVATKEELE